MTKLKRWSYREFAIRQFIPTREFIGVWASEINDGSGEFELVSETLDGLAVATITETHKEGPEDRMRWREDRDVRREVTEDIVGVVLAEGWFQVANEDSNFAGITRVGQDISEATGLLRGDYILKLRGG